MGLDVYLYKVDDAQKARGLEAQYSAEYDAVPLGETQEEHEQFHAHMKEFAAGLGLLEDGEYPREKVEIDSKANPKHYWKIGYFRSSYNNGGFNTVMKRHGLADLYDIFDPAEEYEFTPEWAACLERVKSAIVALDEMANSERGKYTTIDVDLYFKTGIGGESAALDTFFDKLNTHKEHPDFSEFSNREGYYCLNGRKVFAFINGTKYEKYPVIYAVVEESPDNWKDRRECLEIAQETIEYVMAQPDPEKYVFHWSS